MKELRNAIKREMKNKIIDEILLLDRKILRELEDFRII